MRRGISRASALAALFIASCAIAFLVVGIQKVRTIAARATCSNNLYQLDLTFHTYHDAHRQLPPGTMPNPGLAPEQRLSFHVALLPYVECNPLYARLATSESWDSPTNVSAMQDVRLKVYQCPGWSGARDVPLSGHLSITNYVGVAGVGADAAARPLDAPGIGILGYDRKVTWDDVKDGRSNTALLFETGRDVGPWIRGGQTTVRAVDLDDVPLTGVGRQFGGTHGSTWGVLLADGSVRYVKIDVDPAILAALATIAGGEAIPTEW